MDRIVGSYGLRKLVAEVRSTNLHITPVKHIEGEGDIVHRRCDFREERVGASKRRALLGFESKMYVYRMDSLFGFILIYVTVNQILLKQRSFCLKS